MTGTRTAEGTYDARGAADPRGAGGRSGNRRTAGAVPESDRLDDLVVGDRGGVPGRRDDLDAPRSQPPNPRVEKLASGPGWHREWAISPFTGDRFSYIVVDAFDRCGGPPSPAQVWARYPDDALEVIADAPIRYCKGALCGEQVWDSVTRAGKPTPFDVRQDGVRLGTNHWRTCLDRARFQRRRPIIPKEATPSV